jgi:hypothetical protein
MYHNYYYFPDQKIEITQCNLYWNFIVQLFNHDFRDPVFEWLNLNRESVCLPPSLTRVLKAWGWDVLYLLKSLYHADIHKTTKAVMVSQFETVLNLPT